MCTRCDDELESRPLPVRAAPDSIAVAALILAALTAVWVHGQLLDLHIYRMAGAAVLGGSDDLYALRDDASGLSFTYPPFAAMVFAPLAAVGRPAAEVVLTVVSVLCWARVVRCVTRRPVPLLVAGALTQPLLSTVLMGQVNLLLMTMTIPAMLRPTRANALVLGVAAGIKLTPAVFVLGLWVAGQRTAAIRAGGAGLGTVVIGLLVLPRSTIDFFSGTGFSDTRVGGVPYISNQSLNAVLWRLIGPGGDRIAWTILSLAVGGVGMLLVRRLWAIGQRMPAALATALTGLLISPISWSHHWVVLPLLVHLLWTWPGGSGRRRVDLPRVLAGFWAFAGLTWTVWWPPHGGDREYFPGPWQFLAGQSYVLGALATLAFLAVTTRAEGSDRARPAIGALVGN